MRMGGHVGRHHDDGHYRRRTGYRGVMDQQLQAIRAIDIGHKGRLWCGTSRRCLRDCGVCVEWSPNNATQ